MPRDRKRPRLRTSVIGHQVEDIDGADRMSSQLAEFASQLQTVDRRVLVVDLIVGDNRVNHGLPGRARGMTLTPTVADATFAWSMAVDGERQIIITVVGVAQPGATIEVYR